MPNWDSSTIEANACTRPAFIALRYTTYYRQHGGRSPARSRSRRSRSRKQHGEALSAFDAGLAAPHVAWDVKIGCAIRAQGGLNSSPPPGLRAHLRSSSAGSSTSAIAKMMPSTADNTRSGSLRSTVMNVPAVPSRRAASFSARTMKWGQLKWDQVHFPE